MEKFYFEEPSIKRKRDAIEFIEEFKECNSEINGVGGLDRFIEDYESWLEKLQKDYNRISNDKKVPTKTYFFVRDYDNKIIGMLNLRLALNEKLRKDNGNIGYCIRPTERKKDYSKINLYLGLTKAKEFGLEEVLLDADLNNPASWRTIEALGGIKINEKFSQKYKCIVKYYKIVIGKAIEHNGMKYNKFIKEEF